MDSLESIGQILNVQAKRVNEQQVIDLKTRMPFKSSLFKKLGEMMEGSVDMKFDPAQLDAFPSTKGGEV